MRRFPGDQSAAASLAPPPPPFVLITEGEGRESGEQVAVAAKSAKAAVPDRPPALPWARVLISRPPAPPPTRSAPLPPPP